MEPSAWSTVEGGVGSVTGNEGSIFSARGSLSPVVDSVMGELASALIICGAGVELSDVRSCLMWVLIASIWASMARRPRRSPLFSWPEAMLSALPLAMSDNMLSSAPAWFLSPC